MCDMCNGASLDEMRFKIHAGIERDGWSLQYVMDDRPSGSWGYTVGLADSFEHPELVVVGLGMEEAARILTVMCKLVRDGEILEPGEVVYDYEDEFLVSKVHPAHFGRGVFGSWTDYYWALGRRPMQAAVELVPAGRRPMLERAGSRIGAPRRPLPRRRPTRRRPRRR